MSHNPADLSKEPTPDPVEDNAFLPSPYSLSQYTQSKTDFDGVKHQNSYTGGRWKVLMIAAEERYVLCENGKITYQFPITSANSQPDPGTYPVYAKDMNASSSFGGHYSTMTHFVAFTRGKYKGARIAFHSVPKLQNGQYVQTLDSVGTEAAHGQSSGCIRVLPDDSVKIWDWLAVGDKMHVIS